MIYLLRVGLCYLSQGCWAVKEVLYISKTDIFEEK